MVKIVSEETRKKISNTLQGHIHSEETKRKIGLKSLGRMVGFKHSSKSRELMKQRMLGVKPNNKTRAKMSASLREQYLSGKRTPPMEGKQHSEEIRKQMSNLRKKSFVSGLWQSPMKGKTHTLKTRKKLSKSHSGVPLSKLHTQHIKDKLGDAEHRLFAKNRRAKQVFPIKDTTIEIKMQNYLKQLGVEFFTHHYISEIEHGYQCDILIPSKKLVIECDGNYWHNYPYGTEIDLVRNKELREKGYKVLRFWESEIRPMEITDLQNKLIQMRVI
jgi:very-short-patch-repair endonuclease